MNLLVDACVWSLSLRRRQRAVLNLDQQRVFDALQAAVQDGRVAIIGAIRQEVLSGIRDKKQFSKTQQALSPFLDEEILPSDYIDAARLFNSCQDHGVQCGSVDMLICVVAARRVFDILTYDQALLRCIEVLRAAKLVPRGNSPPYQM
jgi:predicted nucleic acid-binding protein